MAERTQHCGGPVEVRRHAVWQVRSWAVDLSAGIKLVRGAIVEAIQVLGAVVSSKGPFSKPNIVLDLVGKSGEVFGVVAGSLDVVNVVFECPVVVVIEDDVLMVVVGEKIIPNVGIVSKRVVEDKLGVWGVSLNKFPDLSVHVLQWLKRGIPPRLVHWLEGCERWVASVPLQQLLTVVDSSLDIVVVDICVLLIGIVPLADPFCCSGVSVVHVVLPRYSPSSASIVESVLRSLGSVHVHPHLYAVLVSSVQHPVDGLV